MKGSMLLVAADSEKEILETLSKDIYTTSGVWDLENVCWVPSFFASSPFGIFWLASRGPYSSILDYGC
jgi:hypothetical protein